MIYTDTLTPTSYATKLATYISDPSTLRARVLEHFAQAPSKERCAKIIAKVREPKKGCLSKRANAHFYKTFHCDHERSDANSELLENGDVVCKTCHEARQKRERERALHAELRRTPPRRYANVIFPDWYQPPVRIAPRVRLTSETLRRVAEAFKIKVSDITGPSRDAFHVDARMIAAVLMRQSGMSYPQIAKWIGRKDHSTSINLIKYRWQNVGARDPLLRKIFHDLGGQFPLDKAA